jgi:hypothetical protein
MNAKTIVENVLTPARARALWTANYFPALPFTPQHFEVGSLLPAMLYMARWGHRRGKGHFIEAFGQQDAQGKAQPPRLVDVARVAHARWQRFRRLCRRPRPGHAGRSAAHLLPGEQAA